MPEVQRYDLIFQTRMCHPFMESLEMLNTCCHLQAITENLVYI